jgi:acetylornithine deacetylase
VEGERLYGRGACDTKGGLAALLLALEELIPQARSLPCDVLLVATVDEEVSIKGAQAFARSGIKADGAIVSEPSSCQPIVAHKGSVRMRFHTRGRSGHSSRPELSDNAIVQMGHVITHLDQVMRPRLKERSHEYCGHPTQSLSVVHGGLQWNIVPPEAYLNVDRRMLPNEDPDEVVDSYERLLEELREAKPEVKVRLEVVRAERGMESPLDSAIIRTSLDVCREVNGQAEPAGVPYGTDAAALWGVARIPCVVLGPGSVDQAHTQDEWVEIAQVPRAARIYAEIARRF